MKSIKKLKTTLKTTPLLTIVAIALVSVLAFGLVQYYFAAMISKTITVEGDIQAGIYNWEETYELTHHNYVGQIDASSFNDQNKLLVSIYSENIDPSYNYIKVSITGGNGLVVTVSGQYYFIWQHEGGQSVNPIPDTQFNIPLDTDVSVDFSAMLWETPPTYTSSYQYTIDDANTLVLSFQFDSSAMYAGEYVVSVNIELGGDTA